MAGPTKPPVNPCSTKAAKTTGGIGQSAITSALTATTIAPSAIRNRLERLASSNSPPGSWLNKPARPLTLSTYPMFCWVHFSSASRTATNGPNPACIPARKKLIASRPLRLVLEGDRSIASDAAVMAIARVRPSFGTTNEYLWSGCQAHHTETSQQSFGVTDGQAVGLSVRITNQATP